MKFHLSYVFVAALVLTIPICHFVARVAQQIQLVSR